jgi:hypothetical protein
MSMDGILANLSIQRSKEAFENGDLGVRVNHMVYFTDFLVGGWMAEMLH